MCCNALVVVLSAVKIAWFSSQPSCPDKLWYIKDVTLCTGNQTSQGHNTNLSLTVCYSQLHSLWQEVMCDSFIDTDRCNNYTASCMHYWSGLLIKSYFTVKVCWFDALQHKSLLTSNWFGTPPVDWWMLLQINTHTCTHKQLFLTIVGVG